MTNRLALLDLATVRQAYAENEQEAWGAIQKLYYRGAQIIFLTTEKRTPQTTQWLEEKELGDYKTVYRDETVKNKITFAIIKKLHSDWKHYFVRSLLESMDAGRFPDTTIVFADKDEKTYELVFDTARTDPRVKAYRSIKDASDGFDLPPEAFDKE